MRKVYRRRGVLSRAKGIFLWPSFESVLPRICCGEEGIV
jgi:hypothetical protein